MEDKIMAILTQILECDIDRETSQENCENWDSIKQLCLAVELESTFDVVFEPDDIEKMKSVNDVIGIVKSKLS